MNKAKKLIVTIVISLVVVAIGWLIMSHLKKRVEPACVIPAWNETLYTIEPDGSLSPAVLKHREREIYNVEKCP